MAGRNTGAALRRRRSQEASDEVTIKLAHPLDEDNPFTGKEEQVDTEIKVTRANARHLIGAGYAQVDPEDQEAVRHALSLGPAAPPVDPAEAAEQVKAQKQQKAD